MSTTFKAAVALCLLAAMLGTRAAQAGGWTYTTVAKASTGPLVGNYFQTTPTINDAGHVAFVINGACNSGPVDFCGNVYYWAGHGLPRVIADSSTDLPDVPYWAAINSRGNIGFTLYDQSLYFWNRSTFYPVGTTGFQGGTLLNNNDFLGYNEGAFYLFANGSTTAATPGYCFQSDAALSSGSSPGGIMGYQGSAGSCAPLPGPSAIYVTNALTGKTKELIANPQQYGTIYTTSANDVGSVALVGLNVPNATGYMDAIFLVNINKQVIQLGAINNGSCSVYNPSNAATCTTYDYDGPISVNNAGNVVGQVSIQNLVGTSPTATGTGLVLNGDMQNGQIIWPGMTINGCQVLGAFVGAYAINSSGQVATLVDCTNDGGDISDQQIVVATPN